MKPDLIFANSPYGKPGVEITKYIMDNFPDANYAMLNTRTAFKKYYDKLACQYATIGKYLLGTNENLHWVEQAILLATNGWTEVVDNRKKDGKDKVGIGCSWPNMAGYSEFRNSHLVGIDRPRLDHTGSMGRSRTSHLVGINHIYPTQTSYQKGRISHLVGAPAVLERAAWNHRERNATLVQIPRADALGVAATHCRSTTLVQEDKSDDTKLRNGYIYVAFETFEEACECAIDIISWKNPTDSHYRCVRWGVCNWLSKP